MKNKTRKDIPGMLTDWQEWMEDFFNISPAGVLHKIGITTPAVNISEDAKSYHIEVAAPGLEKEDFSVTVQEKRLTISSERKKETEQSQANYHRKEFSYSSFSRSFTLPENANPEAVTARYEKGVLKVSIAKKQADAGETAGKKIEII